MDMDEINFAPHGQIAAPVRCTYWIPPDTSQLCRHSAIFQQKGNASLVERDRIFHLWPMTAVFHIEDRCIGDELGDRSGGLEEYVGVVHGGYDESRGT